MSWLDISLNKGMCHDRAAVEQFAISIASHLHVRELDMSRTGHKGYLPFDYWCQTALMSTIVKNSSLHVVNSADFKHDNRIRLDLLTQRNRMIGNVKSLLDDNKTLLSIAVLHLALQNICHCLHRTQGASAAFALLQSHGFQLFPGQAVFRTMSQSQEACDIEFVSTVVIHVKNAKVSKHAKLYDYK
jgi:hypothetical protein